MSKDKPLWEPSEEQVANCNLSRFIERIAPEDPEIRDYDSLYAWSVEHRDRFWAELWEFSGVVHSQTWNTVLENPDAMPGATWFPGARLNYAENLLRYRDDRVAIIARGEHKETHRVTYSELYVGVARYQAILKGLGVGEGDRVAGYMPNIPETILAMLAAASIGAIWSSCSPDFGVKGVVERFSQIEPKVMFAVDGYRYNGKRIDIRDSVKSVVKQISSIEKVILVPYLDSDVSIGGIENSAWIDDFRVDDREMTFAQLPFDHPLYILYSSGTTGKPKCIVHCAGGALIKHLCEQQLHCDLRREDTLFYFTTCGWMMWNWLVSGLASGCTIVLYDGSPFHPSPTSMWDMAEELGITQFGTSARFISSCAKAGVKPVENNDLSSVRAIMSTGSPLVAEGFDYIYENVKQDVMLASISGGTDLCGCFVLGCPMRPVHRGEIQCRALGMAVDVYLDGEPVRGERGELVCTKPFPSMPLGFWNEPNDERYHNAYFARFPNTWTQGDYAEITPHDGMIIYGRSDAVLNPGGVRIGTAEIYRQVEKVDEVLESLCIGQKWDDDVRIVLFIILREGVEMSDELADRIRNVIRQNATPRHVPQKIVAVSDIPRTLSGKIVELAVRSVVHGDPVKNTEALANPESLELFRDLPQLQEA